MFESLIRDASAPDALGNEGARFVRMLADAVFDNGTGGFDGLRQRFAEADLGPLFTSWIGGSPGNHVLRPDQFGEVLGDKTVRRMAGRLGHPRSTVLLVGADLLPRMIGMITRGGTLPSGRPPDYDHWFVMPAAPAAPQAVRRDMETDHDPLGGGIWWKWMVALVVLVIAGALGLRACQEEADPTHPSDATAMIAATSAAMTVAPAGDAVCGLRHDITVLARADDIG